MAMESASHDSARSMFQLINGEGIFNDSGLEKFREIAKLERYGLNYAVVSIIGPQSGGKSTLLNHLFKTKFEVMDDTKIGKQTTRGIWLAKATHIEPCTLVMDVEGTDGVERGEDDTVFERKSALFALAVSDVVMINIMHKDLTREQGGSRPLLKLAFEKIFTLNRQCRITLLFVIRDKIPNLRFELLRDDLLKSIKELYDSVPKPYGHEKTPLNKVFDVQICALPNYVYSNAEFKEQVSELRKQFFKFTASSDELHQDQADKLPASGFYVKLRKVWKIINENKDLELPKVKVMVSTVRCDDLMDEILSDLNKEWQGYEKDLKSVSPQEFGQKISSIIEDCLLEYDGKTTHYDKDVVKAKRQKLKMALQQLEHIQSAKATMLENLLMDALKDFKTELDKARDNENLQVADILRQNSLSKFDKACQDMENVHVKCNSSQVRDRVNSDIVGYTTTVTLTDALARKTEECEIASKKAVEAMAQADKAAREAENARKMGNEKMAEALEIIAKNEAKKAKDAEDSYNRANNDKNKAKASLQKWLLIIGRMGLAAIATAFGVPGLEHLIDIYGAMTGDD